MTMCPPLTPPPPICPPQPPRCHRMSTRHTENKEGLSTLIFQISNQNLNSGTVILRGIVPKDILKILQPAVKDIEKNKTLHCNMAYFSGPPILHRCLVDLIYGQGVLKDVFFRYSSLCQWPERAHDHFRDALYLSPLASAASQLLAGAPVRQCCHK